MVISAAQESDARCSIICFVLFYMLPYAFDSFHSMIFQAIIFSAPVISVSIYDFIFYCFIFELIYFSENLLLRIGSRTRCYWTWLSHRIITGLVFLDFIVPIAFNPCDYVTPNHLTDSSNPLSNRSLQELSPVYQHNSRIEDTCCWTWSQWLDGSAVKMKWKSCWIVS